MDKVEALLQRVASQRQFPSPPALRFLRERSGLSQGDVAAALGVSLAAVSSWERGSREPRPAHRAAYLALLDKLAGIA